jgi:hypothetical protein
MINNGEPSIGFRLATGCPLFSGPWEIELEFHVPSKCTQHRRGASDKQTSDQESVVCVCLSLLAGTFHFSLFSVHKSF